MRSAIDLGTRLPKTALRPGADIGHANNEPLLARLATTPSRCTAMSPPKGYLELGTIRTPDAKFGFQTREGST